MAIRASGRRTVRRPLEAIPGGEFTMGDDGPLAYESDGESPTRVVTVEAYLIERAPVTNDAFAEFVEDTGYRTEAERFGWSFVFAGSLPDDFPETQGVVGAEWWRVVTGSWWREPEGPGSGLAGRGDHPVVHVSWHDARAYALWAGRRLPTEPEWERAARATTTSTFPWGEELEPGGRHMANVFQGGFPADNTADDGWAATSPVGWFPANAFGMVDMIGNVWEWTADRFDRAGQSRGNHRTLKGGSYLCHHSYCARYRPGARMGLSPETTTGHIGFRCAEPADQRAR